MKEIVTTNNYNYIAVFLTLACNYRCSYCINYFDDLSTYPHLSGKDYVRGLNRIVSRDDVPVTLQGGEPSVHKDFIYIVNNIRPELQIDILTNLQFDVDEFAAKVDPARLRRNAPYANIRVSYHPEVMDLEETVKKTLKLQEAGFCIGIWGVMHPTQEDIILDAQDKCKALGIDFRTKEFLGEHNGKVYGTYRHKGACDKRFKKRVLCKTTELIVGPGGDVYRCHSDLYGRRKPIGNILDPDFRIEDIYRECDIFGHCNPCDLKVKTNRLQQYGHTSVDIKFISTDNLVASGAGN